MSKEKKVINQCSKKNVPYLAFRNHETRTITIVKPRCWCWNCPECSEARADYWSKRVHNAVNERMEKGEIWFFVTLTSHEKCVNYTQTAYVLRRSFPKLYNRILRKYSGLMFVSIPEPHQDNRLHVHMLTNAPMTTAWYKKNARECGFGYQAKAVKIEQASRAAFYVVKYLSKSLTNAKLFGKRFQRVRVSKDFPELADDIGFPSLPSEVIGKYDQARVFISINKDNGWRIVIKSSGEEL